VTSARERVRLNSQPIGLALPRLTAVGVALLLGALALDGLVGCSSAEAGLAPSAGGIIVEVHPLAPRVPSGSDVSFAATVTGTPNTVVSWAVPEAGGGVVDASGHYTAPQATGVFHVVATSSANPLAQGIATITVVAAPLFQISGTVGPSSLIADTTISLSGSSGATTTVDASGNFTFGGLANGNYAVTPTKAGFTFTPTTRSITLSGGDVAGLTFTASTFSPNLTVDGSRTFQTMDGMGTSINVESWKSGQLKPALDLLVDVNGASLLRVSRDPMDWVSNEADIAALHSRDAATLARVYESAGMQDLWSTISYLNTKGLGGGQIVVNFMGWTPIWLGGSGAYGSPSYITAGKEGAFATMVASLLYYGRAMKGLDFTCVAPMNEPDWDAKEGPNVSAGQYATVLASLASELAWFGLNDLRIVGPDTASSPANYVAQMMGNATVSGRVDHLAFHTYSGATSPGTSYAGKNYWLTETAVWCDTCDQNGSPSGGEWGFARDTGDVILQDITNGFPAVLVWEGYDSFWYHHNSYSTWGLLAYNKTTGVYTPRKRFYVNSQITRFIRAGMKRVGVTISIGGLTALAFHDTSTRRVTIVGHNSGNTPVTINGQFSNMPETVTSLSLFQTDSGSSNMQRGTDVPVSGGSFSVTVAADTFYSLSN
jgi:O-glycosyl hydrolase